MPRTRLPKAPVTVQGWADCWLDLYPGKRNEKTARHVAYMCAPFVRAHGSKPLAAVEQLVAQRWAVANPGHVKYLRQMFDKAVAARLLTENVWRFVEVDAHSTPRLPPTPAGLALLIGAARARGGWWDNFADLIVFTAYVGPRQEEVVRVQASDVLEGGSRVVLRGKRRAGEREFRVRTVAVLGPAREALRRQAPQVGLVWRSQSGSPLTGGQVQKAYRELRREVGVSETFHGLRHFCASWLLDQGASKVDVAIQLGYMDEAGRVDTTQVTRVYGHMSADPALRRLEALANEGVPHVGDGDSGAGAVRGAAGPGVDRGEQDPEAPRAVQA